MSIICRLPQGSIIDEQLINYTVLYNEGDECVDATGGWTTSTSTTVNVGARIRTNKTLDLSQYSKVMACATVATTGSATAYAMNLDTPSATLLNLAGGTTYTKQWTIRDIPDGAKTTTDMYFCVSKGETFTNPVARKDTDSMYLSITYSSSQRQLTVYHLSIFKEDNWQEWLIKGGLTVGNYTSLDAVMADSTALNTLMNNADAVNYMLKKCTGTVMASVIQSSNALSAIRDSQYNAEIFANEHWNKFLQMVGETPESERNYLYKNGTDYGNLNYHTEWSGYNIVNENGLLKMGFANTTTTSKGQAVVTKTKIDLTGYKKIKVIYESIQSNNKVQNTCGIWFGITNGSFAEEADIVARTVETSDTSTQRIRELDISAVTGEYYIRWQNWIGGNTTLTASISAFWLE